MYIIVSLLRLIDNKIHAST